VQTQVTEAGPFERLLKIQLGEDELEAAKTAAANKLSKQMKVKGFRPGKVPRQIVERMVGADTLRSEAIDEALPEAVGNALEAEDLSPVTRPAITAIEDIDGGGVEVDVVITLWPSVEAVPDFAGREVAVDIAAVTQEAIDEQVDRLRGQYATLEDVDRSAEDGDFVMIDLSASIEGEVIEDAGATDLLYEVGSASFVDGLDELLKGTSAEDTPTGPGTLPEGFGDRGGQEVELTATVKAVRAKDLPEVTDEWVQDVSEFESVDELLAMLRHNMTEMAKATARNDFQDRVMTDLAEDLNLELPQSLIDTEAEASIHNLAHRLQEQGIGLENYLQITGQSQEDFVEDSKTQAVRTLKTRVLLEGVAKVESLQVSDDEILEAVSALASQAEMNPEELFRQLEADGRLETLSDDILRKKALEAIMAGVVAVDDDGNTIDLEPAPADSDEDNDFDSDEAKLESDSDKDVEESPEE
jgi:trigger factor